MIGRMTSRLAAVALLALGTSLVPADEVILTTGERREGRVEPTPGDPASITLLTGSQQIRIPLSRIESIVEHDDAQDYTILGNQFIRSQNYERAVQMFQRALESDPQHAPARSGMEQARRLISDRQQEAERRQQSQNTERLSEARQLIEEERFIEAEQLLSSVAETAGNEELRAAAQLARRDLYLAWSKDREDRLDPVGAELYLNKVLEIDPDNPQARDVLLRVWERDPSKREQLVEIYRAKLEETPGDLIMNQKLADLLLAMNRSDEAIGPLKRLYESGRFRALRYDERLQRALENTAQNHAQRGDLDAALATYEELLEYFPNADPTPLSYLRYERRLQDIPADDWEARAALLSDLSAQGLKHLALQEADFIVRNDPQNQVALGMLRQDSSERLQEVQDAMGRGQFTLAKSLARNFVQGNPRFPDLVQAASDLYTRADLEAQRQARRLRDQAREIVAQGDTYLYEARRYAELHKSADNQNRSRILTYKNEALKFARRAIETYEVALQIDPSVGPLVGGMDVNTKLQDARVLEGSLTRQPIITRLPQGRTYGVSGSGTGAGTTPGTGTGTGGTGTGTGGTGTGTGGTGTGTSN